MAQRDKATALGCSGRQPSSEPLPLEEAKKAAIAMLDERGKTEPRDWIARLNQIAANEVDRAVVAREKRKWPDIMSRDAVTRAIVAYQDSHGSAL